MGAAMDYIAWLSMIGTRYGVYVSLVDRAKGVLLIMMIGYRVYWIEKERGIEGGDKVIRL
jgi:hypothetical protein